VKPPQENKHGVVASWEKGQEVREFGKGNMKGSSVQRLQKLARLVELIALKSTNFHNTESEGGFPSQSSRVS
jgi:hypothetical protein